MIYSKNNLKKLLNRLNDLILKSRVSTSTTDLLTFFSIINEINDKYSTSRIKRLPLNGTLFKFITIDNYKKERSLLKREALLAGLYNTRITEDGVNRQGNQPHSIYVKMKDGRYSSLFLIINIFNDEERVKYEHEIYSYIKSFKGIFDPSWIK